MLHLALKINPGPAVHPELFDVPIPFAGALKAASVGAKRKTAPGSEKIRVEILQIATELLATSLMALRRAMGRRGYMPSILRSRVLVPSYKKGD